MFIRLFFFLFLFSSLFVFFLFSLILSLLLLIAAVNLSLLFFSSPCKEATQFSILATLSFLDTYSQSILSLSSEALCIIINFLVLWSICLIFTIVHFKKGPEYLAKEADLLFIPLMRFLLQSLVSRSFLVLLKYFLLPFFLHLSLFDCVCFQYLVLCVISFFPSVLMIALFGCFILSVVSRHIFLCKIPSLYTGCILLLFFPGEFFTSVLADGPSLEVE